MSEGLFDLTEALYTPASLIGQKGELSVRSVHWTALEALILTKHYAGRMPSITYAYGLFLRGSLVGGLTIGKPASAPLCDGLAGPDYRDQIYELNRLILDRAMPPNALSWFVGATLRDLGSSELILVSFADDGVGHHGYIYQATNWTYTGKSVERTDKYMPGGKHPRHYTEEYSHLRKVRTPKHRYIAVPNKRLRRHVLRDLRYPILPYPKGDNRRYQLGQRFADTIINTNTGASFADGTESPKGSA